PGDLLRGLLRPLAANVAAGGGALPGGPVRRPGLHRLPGPLLLRSLHPLTGRPVCWRRVSPHSGSRNILPRSALLLTASLIVVVAACGGGKEGSSAGSGRPPPGSAGGSP